MPEPEQGSGVQGRERSKGEREMGDDFEARQDSFQIMGSWIHGCQMLFVFFSVILLLDNIIT